MTRVRPRQAGLAKSASSARTCRSDAPPGQSAGTAARAASRAARRTLAPHVGLRLIYGDDTHFGSAISGRCERELQRRLAVLYAYREKYGLAHLVRNAREVLGRVLPRWLGDLYCAPDRLRDKWLYPDPSRVRPVQLRVERDLAERVATIDLAASVARDLARHLGDWQAGAGPPRSKAARTLWDALLEAGALVSTRKSAMIERPAGVRYVGHATLEVGNGERRLLIDPYLLPASRRYPRDWQPLTLGELGRPDAVLVTHSHPDHFDPGTLLRCGADTPIYVPAVGRESVLAIDMAARLRELGFRNVHGVEDWTGFHVGAMGVHALPFYGEQPTVGERLHPEIRNQGATWLVEAAGRRVAALADAGCDCAGDTRQLAGQARALHGPVDTVFGGYRGFALYPAQYAFSSVSRYLAFVPPGSWGARQQIMCDADDLIDVAEHWHARRIVPYAAGGAPWYWLRGLGPCLDGSAPDALSTDPPPAHVVEAAARRAVTRADGLIASPVSVQPMRVGEFVEFEPTPD